MFIHMSRCLAAAALLLATAGVAVLDLTDSRFAGMLQRARPAGIPFNPQA